eukprot:355524-Chlamydomonas_euryale.AAC.48
MKEETSRGNMAFCGRKSGSIATKQAVPNEMGSVATHFKEAPSRCPGHRTFPHPQGDQEMPSRPAYVAAMQANAHRPIENAHESSAHHTRILTPHEHTQTHRRRHVALPEGCIQLGHDGTQPRPHHANGDRVTHVPSPLKHRSQPVTHILVMAREHSWEQHRIGKPGWERQACCTAVH